MVVRRRHADKTRQGGKKRKRAEHFQRRRIKDWKLEEMENEGAEDAEVMGCFLDTFIQASYFDNSTGTCRLVCDLVRTEQSLFPYPHGQLGSNRHYTHKRAEKSADVVQPKIDAKETR